MNLDRYTQKAQEAILAAQRLATELQSPVLDAEHLLAALLEDDEGIPAETLRRLGVDLPRVPRRAGARPSAGAPAIAGRLADAWTRAPSSSSSGPRTRHAASSDEYVSTEHLLLGVAESRAARPSAAGRGTAPSKEAILRRAGQACAAASA